MAKKLTIEVDADVAKAKAKMKKAVAEASAEGGASPSPAAPSSSADALSKSLKNASKNLDELGAKSHASASQIAGVVRSFAGMGIGMAMNYSTQYMRAGAARDAVQVGAGSVQGASLASAAAMALPGGAIVKALITALGAVVGGVKVASDQKLSREKDATEFARTEKDYQSARRYRDFLTSLNDTRPGALTRIEKLDAAQAELQKYKDVEPKLVQQVKTFIGKGDTENAEKQKAYLADNRSRQEQLEGIIRGLAVNATRNLADDYATAGDALSKVGGAFAGGGGPVEMTDKVMGRKADRQIQLLEKIANKNGGATWQ